MDAFDLDVTTSAGTDFNVVRNLGEAYLLTVSGTFSLGSDPVVHVTDAEYFNLGTYNASNVYTASIVGTGSTINLFFADFIYTDNTGSLGVSISSVSAVPLPAGAVLLLSGLAGLGLSRRRRT